MLLCGADSGNEMHLVLVCAAMASLRPYARPQPVSDTAPRPTGPRPWLPYPVSLGSLSPSSRPAPPDQPPDLQPEVQTSGSEGVPPLEVEDRQQRYYSCCSYTYFVKDSPQARHVLGTARLLLRPKWSVCCLVNGRLGPSAAPARLSRSPTCLGSL